MKREIKLTFTICQRQMTKAVDQLLMKSNAHKNKKFNEKLIKMKDYTFFGCKN